MHRPRALWRSILFTMLLAVLLGIATGIPLLRYLLIPFAAWLERFALSYPEISCICLLIMLLCGLTICGIAVISHYLVQGKERRPGLGWLMIIASALVAAYGVQQLYFRPSGISANSLPAELHDRRLSFGPYPDQQMLLEISAAGVEQIISLLNPLLPLEALRLTEERAAAEQLGITVHSFPLLNWVGDNQPQLVAATELIKSLPDQGFYIHSYLGRLRVGLLRTHLQDQEVAVWWADQP